MECLKILFGFEKNRVELDKRRRQGEQIANESSLKLQELEFQRGDLESRLNKALVEIDGLNGALEEAEVKLTKSLRTESVAQSELNDLHARLDEETELKLCLQSQLRQAEDDREALKDTLENDEQLRANFEKQILNLSQQVC